MATLDYNRDNTVRYLLKNKWKEFVNTNSYGEVVEGDPLFIDPVTTSVHTYRDAKDIQEKRDKAND